MRFRRSDRRREDVHGSPNRNESVKMKKEKKKKKDEQPRIIDPASLEGLSEEEAMMRVMGFGGFNTSHGKKVETNHDGAQTGACRKVAKRKYRQYMNRIGGSTGPRERG